MRSGVNVQKSRCEELRFLADFWEGAEPRAASGGLGAARNYRSPQGTVRAVKAHAHVVSLHTVSFIQSESKLRTIVKQVLQDSEIDCVMHFTWLHTRHAKKAQDKVTRPTRYNEGLTNQIQSQLLRYVQGSVRQSLRQGSRCLFDAVIRHS